MKRLLTLLMIGILLLASTPVAYGQPQGLDLTGKSAILMDATTGEILYEKNIHTPLYPASTTKMLTGILAMERLEMDEPVPIDEEIAFTGGSRIFLLEGEEVVVEDVLYALFLESANDAAVALAKKISGTVEDFARLMNAKAREIGTLNSNFVNPNGLHDDAHISTAYDMAMIARYAMKNEIFRKYVSTYRHVMEETNMQETRYFYNTNRLLYDTVNKVAVNGVYRDCKYEGVTGIKTGYTSQAGGCLVAGARRGDTELIAVVLGSTDMGRFADSVTLLDYGFENFRTVRVVEEGMELGTIPVKRGAVNRVDVVTARNAHATLPVKASEHLLRQEVNLVDALNAPVKKGQKAGTLRIFAGEKLVDEFDVVTLDGVEEGGIMALLAMNEQGMGPIQTILTGLLAVFLAAGIFYVVMKRRQIQKKKLLKQQQRQQERERREAEQNWWKEAYHRSRKD